MAVVLTLLVGAAPAAPTAAADADPLFTPAADQTERAADPHAIRRRFVTVDPGVLLSAAREGGDASVTLNLFDDTVLTGTRADLETRGPGDFTWVGRVGAGGTAVVTVQDGAVVGRIADPGNGTFTITPAAEGVHVIAEVDPATYPAEHDVPSGPGGSGRADTAPVAYADPVLVTVLVLYTPAAAADLGGAAAADALAASLVAEANLAFADSGVVHRLLLAWARDIDYAESGTSQVNLDRLTDPDDGYLDEVPTWRDQAIADLVVLVVAPMSDFCGSGWMMYEADPSFAEQAFAVVSWDCARDNLSFAHEVGHLFGAYHEPGQSGRGVYPFSRAYVDCANGFRTVMAYGNECAVRPARVARFSSLGHPYLGFPAGSEYQDNARTLNRTGPVVAAFRG
ncbi:MAG: type domain protein, partial [Acidobacteria bacterium]|nr:type domain protein [Acidobacteriota bacterium]